MKKKITVSVYCKGHRQSTSYYRCYQYFDKIDEITPKYHVMMSKWVEKKLMPISRQPLYVQMIVYLHIVVRVFVSLLKDYVNPPDVIFVHRRLVSRYTPSPLKWLLKSICGKGTPLFWDIDDNVKGRELTENEWELFSRISTQITVTHSFLGDLVSDKYRHKVVLLPTTDGDLYEMFSPKVNESRMMAFEKEIRMVWVATSVNLKHIEYVAPYLDNAAKELMKDTNKQLVLNVVCDRPLVYDFKFLKLKNIKWTRERAIQNMLDAHIGIMPLLDDDFTRGKGGFKLVQYQSIGLPSIASNVGYNSSVVTKGTGFLVDKENLQLWCFAITELADKDRWLQYSSNAYNNWTFKYPYVKNLEFWRDTFMRTGNTANESKR